MTLLWAGAALTAISAAVFPRFEQNAGGSPWEIPIVIAVTIALFTLLGGWAWRGESNRPAKVALVCGVLGLVGVIAFFVMAPIILGGLAVTLGLEGRDRAAAEGRGTQAAVGIILGAVAFVVGAGIWFFV
jgi:hypothetical protein